MENLSIPGHSQVIALRSYMPSGRRNSLPIVLYFHGGGFVAGSLADGDTAAATIARTLPAWVISVGYSLSPRFPFPTALEDGYRGFLWAIANASAQGADPYRVGIAGHDAGGNLATCVCAVARDRSEFQISAQILLAPLLNPSMTHSSSRFLEASFDQRTLEISNNYNAYLPSARLRMHPYAAPIDSQRLVRLPPTLILSADCDILDVEAKQYAAGLRASGVSANVIRYPHLPHLALTTHNTSLTEMIHFFRTKLSLPSYILASS